MDAYFDRLHSLSSSYVTLYDILDKRAWLTNGLHALLHLVRASLKRDIESEFAAECVLNLSDFIEDADSASPRAAINFLSNRHNLERPIFANPDDLRTEEKQKQTTGGTDGGASDLSKQKTCTEYRTSTPVLLKDRVNQIVFVLEQLMDYQANLHASGVPIKLTPRKNLEGYRFMDIAARRPLTPRIVRLSAYNGAGKSWVDFIRAVKAVTLFGEGFGELLAPCRGTADSSVCPGWETLPKGGDYLAVSAYDISRILREEGSTGSNPLKLAPGILWHQPSTIFDPCACLGYKKPEVFGMPIPGIRLGCDRAQVLLPQSLQSRLPKSGSPPNTIGAEGAIVFGRSEIFPWKWPDHGDPNPDRGPTTQKEKDAVGTGLTNMLASLLLLKPTPVSATPYASPSSTSASMPATQITRASVGETESTQITSDEVSVASASNTAPKRRGLWQVVKDIAGGSG